MCEKDTLNTRLNQFVTYLLDVMLAAVGAAEVLLPLYLPKLFLRYQFLTVEGRSGPQIDMRLYWPKFFLTLGAGVFAILILWELRRMMGTVIRNDCFVDANVTSLKRMGRYAMVIAALMLLSNLSVPTMTAAVVTLVFIIAGLFSIVLAGVFARAVQYKRENDLTI